MPLDMRNIYAFPDAIFFANIFLFICIFRGTFNSLLCSEDGKQFHFMSGSSDMISYAGEPEKKKTFPNVQSSIHNHNANSYFISNATNYELFLFLSFFCCLQTPDIHFSVIHSTRHETHTTQTELRME